MHRGSATKDPTLAKVLHTGSHLRFSWHAGGSHSSGTILGSSHLQLQPVLCRKGYFNPMSQNARFTYWMKVILK